MAAEPKLNPGFAVTVSSPFSPRPTCGPRTWLAGLTCPREVVEACLKGKVPEAEVLYRIAKGLDRTMEWLLTGEGVKLPKEILQ